MRCVSRALLAPAQYVMTTMRTNAMPATAGMRTIFCENLRFSSISALWGRLDPTPVAGCGSTMSRIFTPWSTTSSET